MGLLDDISVAADRFRRWGGETAERARRWAASEDGQTLLTGLDYLSLSSQLGDFYQRWGWYLPVHPALHRYVLEHHEFHRPFDPRSVAGLVGPGSEHWGWIVQGTLDSPTLESRSTVIEDAIFCMEQERWHAAVSTLLPVIEGVISDRSGILKDKRVGRRLEHILHTETGRWESLGAVPALDVVDEELFAREDFAGVALDETALNRHLILHGRAVGFGRRETAVRVFMLLVALAELLDGWIISRADPDSVPDDAGSVLDDYGPLAPIRISARDGAPQNSTE